MEFENGIRVIRVNWKLLTKSLPCGRDPESTERRNLMFGKWDLNGNGNLSFSECDNAMRKLMGEVMGGFLTSALTSWNLSWKPVIMRAFQHSKDANKREGKKKKLREDDYVEKDEFRLLLLCMRQYFELYVAFSKLDVNADRKLSKEEFINAVPHLARWNITMTEEEAEAEFSTILKSDPSKHHAFTTKGKAQHEDVIMFEEFIRWALIKNLDLDDDDDFDDFDIEGGEIIPGGRYTTPVATNGADQPADDERKAASAMAQSLKGAGEVF